MYIYRHGHRVISVSGPRCSGNGMVEKLDEPLNGGLPLQAGLVGDHCQPNSQRSVVAFPFLGREDLYSRCNRQGSRAHGIFPGIG